MVRQSIRQVREVGIPLTLVYTLDYNTVSKTRHPRSDISSPTRTDVFSTLLASARPATTGTEPRQLSHPQRCPPPHSRTGQQARIGTDDRSRQTPGEQTGARLEVMGWMGQHPPSPWRQIGGRLTLAQWLPLTNWKLRVGS